MFRLSMTVFFVLAFAASLSHPAEAQHRKHLRSITSHVSPCIVDNDGHRVCGSDLDIRRAQSSRASRGRKAYASYNGTIIGGRPAGCPHRYCGCGLRKYLGLSDKRLNLARNWARLFPRVSGPAAGVAAVRSGHVMYIERSADNGQWLVRDYNSGGGLSRLHVRDVRGYIFVDPHIQSRLLAKN